MRPVIPPQPLANRGRGSVTFVIDQGMLADTPHVRLPMALRRLGYTVEVTEYCRDTYREPLRAYSADECIVLYGSIGFVEQRLRNSNAIPGSYYTKDRLACSHYMPRLPLELLGNAEGVYLPFGDFVRRRDQIYRLFGDSRLFVRPDSGGKTFTGLCLEQETAGVEINSLRQLTSVTDDTRVLIAPAQSIRAEYRFFIVEGKVVTGSRYHVNGQRSIDPVVSKLCLEVAQQVAALPWQVDLAYTCDVGLFAGEPKVVELNAFSTSGLYACHALRLFDAVGKVAWREFIGELSLES
jgi:hypothetical protein